MKFAMIFVALLTILPHPQLHAQGSGELLVGAWIHDVEGMDEKVVLRFFEDEKADMGWTEDEKIVDKRSSSGTWTFEDEDVNEKEQTVLTFIVQWKKKGEAAVEATRNTVVATMLSEDKMEVRWGDEPMRVWDRLKPEDKK